MENERGSANQKPDNGQNPLAEASDLPQLLAPAPQQLLKTKKKPLIGPKGRLLCLLALFLISAGVIWGAIKLYVPSGSEKWSHQIGGTWGSSSPMIVNGIVYIGKGDNTVYALSESSGHIMWSNHLGNYTDVQAPTRSGIVPLPIVANDRVYVNSQNCFLYALNASTGQNVWSFGIPGCSLSAPVVANGLVYIGSEDGTLYALNAISGHQIWSSKERNFISFRSSPVVNKGFLYSAGPNGDVHALDAASGREKWDAFIEGSGVESFSPAVANDTIYITTVFGVIAALDINTGHEKWSSSYQTTGFTSSPVVVGNTIYIYSYAGLYALDIASGSERWFHRMPGTRSVPLVVNGTVYVGTADTLIQESNGTFQPDDKLYALDAVSGDEQWFYQLGGRDYSTPAMSHGVIYVGADDGKVYALLPPG